MVTDTEFKGWLESEDFFFESIDNGVKFAGNNPWDEVQNGDYHGTIRLIDGILHVNFVEDGWNGYGEEKFESIGEFAARWTDVMTNGLQG